MNILVVYDSMYGNTEKIAQAIGTATEATVLHVNQVKEEHLAGLDILIVGSPTQAFQPLKPLKTFLKRSSCRLPEGSQGCILRYPSRFRGGRQQTVEFLG